MTITCQTRPMYHWFSTHDAPARNPGLVVSRASKIIILAFFASSFVRNNIYRMKFMSCKIFPDESYEKSPSLKAFVLMIKNVLNVKSQCGSPPLDEQD